MPCRATAVHCLVLIAQVIFLLDHGHTDKHTHTHSHSRYVGPGFIVCMYVLCTRKAIYESTSAESEVLFLELKPD